jgi:hypothetical protein
MKHILIVGAGGIGSHLCRELIFDVERKMISPKELKITIQDFDTISPEQTMYQWFDIRDSGRLKVRMLLEMLQTINIKSHSNSFAFGKSNKLKGKDFEYDLVVMCVDHNPTREVIIRKCWIADLPYIDLRCEGRKVFYATKGHNLINDLAYLNVLDTEHGSCQLEEDKKSGRIQKGNRLIALIGSQLIVDFLRGEKIDGKIQSITI